LGLRGAFCAGGGKEWLGRASGQGFFHGKSYPSAPPDVDPAPGYAAILVALIQAGRASRASMLVFLFLLLIFFLFFSKRGLLVISDWRNRKFFLFFWMNPIFAKGGYRCGRTPSRHLGRDPAGLELTVWFFFCSVPARPFVFCVWFALFFIFRVRKKRFFGQELFTLRQLCFAARDGGQGD